MTKQWQFIEALGGGVYPEMATVPRLGNVCLNLPGIGATWFPISVLSVVEEFPPEPPAGTVVQARLMDEGKPWTWERLTDPTLRWFTTGLEDKYTWRELCRCGVPQVLIPAPEPVKLPWVAQCATGIGDTLHICDPDGDSQVPVIVPGRSSVYLTPENARAGGYALLAAADQAEAATQ